MKTAMYFIYNMCVAHYIYFAEFSKIFENIIHNHVNCP